MIDKNKINTKLINILNMKEPFNYTEIGDGNVNYVYRVKDVGGKTCIIKYGADHIRNNEKRKLSSDRNRIEHYILTKQRALINGMVPEIYFYDETLKILVMEDLGEYKILWNELEKYKIFTFFDEQMALFLYNTLFKTTDLCMKSDEKKRVAGKLINVDMCEISERLVFTEPIFNKEGLNSFAEKNAGLVKNKIYTNEKVILSTAKLKEHFKNYSQSMLHGDLHTGSIFINEYEIKVFDPEFSFYGPMGYDIGNILGNLIISYVVSAFSEKSELSYRKWLNTTIRNILIKFMDLYNKNYDEDVIEVTAKNEAFKKYYLDNIIKDSFGYMGTEILRRTIGMAKVPQLKNINDNKNKSSIEKILIEISVYLIENFEQLRDIGHIMEKLDEEIVNVKNG